MPRCCWPPTLGLPPGDESGFWFHMIPPARHPRSLPRIPLKGPLDRERRRGMIARVSSRPSPAVCCRDATRRGFCFACGTVSGERPARDRGADPRYAALSACGTAARPLVKTKGLFPRSPRQRTVRAKDHQSIVCHRRRGRLSAARTHRRLDHHVVHDRHRGPVPPTVRAPPRDPPRIVRFWASHPRRDQG